MAIILTPVEDTTLIERVRYLARIPSTITTAQLQANLDVAERVLEASDTKDYGLDSDLLDTIRVYLGAHFTVLALGGDTTELTIRGSSQKFAKNGLTGGLRSTEYGRTAIMLDISGLLAAFSKAGEQSRVKPRLDYIGSEITYDNLVEDSE